MGKMLSTNTKVNYKKPFRQRRAEKQQAAKDKALNDLIAEAEGADQAYRIARYRKLGGDAWKTAKEYMDNNPAFAKGVKRNYKNSAKWINEMDKGVKPGTSDNAKPMYEEWQKITDKIFDLFDAKYPNDPEKAGAEYRKAVFGKKPFSKWMEEKWIKK